MINNNLDYGKSSYSTVGTTTLAVDNTVSLAATTVSATMPMSTHNHNNSNDNSYFSRFDNRIAANLAAVINGTRFRSASTSGASSPFAKQRNGSSNHINANSIGRHHSNISNSSSNLRAHHNGFATVGTRQTPPPMHLQLSSVGNGSRPSSPLLGHMGSMGRQRRQLHLLTQGNFNCNDNEKVAHTPPSSDEDNSPTELNNCKRLADKPPLVKRLTMGLLRAHEESRPLVNTSTTTTTTTTTTSNMNSTSKLNSSASNKIYSNGYINEEAFEPEKYIASKFGDSCRQSLTAIPMLDTVNLNDNSEFNLKKRYLRETSSANSSPKIFANRLRANTATSTRYNNADITTSSTSNTAASDDDDEEADLKNASWFQAGISRDIAVEVLSSKSPGAFLVRKSSSKPGCYALTLRVPSPPGPKTANYIILRTTRGYKIKGFRKEFTTLKALITHHSVMPELLPVPLALPRPTNMTSSRRNIDDFDTYDSLQMLLKYLRAKNMENE